MLRKILCLTAMPILLGIGSVQASILVLNDAGQQQTIGVVIFETPASSIGNIPSGTGSFLRFKDTQSGEESGFNTDSLLPLTPAPVDMTTSYSLPTNTIPLVQIGGSSYREFALSIQESGNPKFLDLNVLKLAGTSNPSVQDFTSLTPFTIINSGTTDTIELYDVYGGTNIDMLMYVPSTNSVFLNDYVVMYNLFTNADDGPDEWAVRPLSAIPEPTTIIIWSLFVGVGIVFGYWRKRKVD
jgi:hypothetical protein